MLPVPLLALCLSLLTRVDAYSFNFTSTPQQCATLSLQIVGTGGSPPYRALILPWGASPLPNNIEARRIVDVQFNDTTSVSFQLRFPENSQFVAVVSDSTGFGTGGTSVTGIVQQSGDSSCFDASTNVAPSFWFDLNPQNQLVQCVSSRLWWDPSLVSGTVSFQGVVPGGQSFSVPSGSLTNITNFGEGFDWTPSVRGGTSLEIVAGDSRGIGSGGSLPLVISTGSNAVSNCLSDNSPSSTPGSPAGGSYPTSTSGAGTGGSNPSSGNTPGPSTTTGSGGGSGGGGSHHSTNVGAIVGGVIGGVAAILAGVLVLLFCFRRKRFHQTQKERPVDLLQDGEHEGSDDGRRDELPQYYRPEPFLLPDPTVASTAGADEDGHLLGGDGDGDAHSNSHRPSIESFGRRTSTVPSLLGLQRPTTPDRRSQTQTSASGQRKNAAGPTPLRPVNIIQHEDAGPPEPTEEGASPKEAETIELPPAYTHLRGGAGSATGLASASRISSVPEEALARPPSAAA